MEQGAGILIDSLMENARNMPLSSQVYLQRVAREETIRPKNRENTCRCNLIPALQDRQITRAPPLNQLRHPKGGNVNHDNRITGDHYSRRAVLRQGISGLLRCNLTKMISS